MMRKIAIGLAAATIALSGSTLGASAYSTYQGHMKSGISKGSAGRLSHRVGPRTYGYYTEEERGRRGERYERMGRYDRGERYGYKPDRFDGAYRHRGERYGYEHLGRLDRLSRLEDRLARLERRGERYNRYERGEYGYGGYRHYHHRPYYYGRK